MFSQTEENYIKAIYALSVQTGKAVSTNLIAEKMDTKASSVTDMIKKLSDKKLVNYKKYQGVSLTKMGQKTALSIIRKHRLWEVFLVDKLDFSWDEVHDIAEQLEHIQSEKLIDKLDEHLGFPSFDPHGDPIPNKEGKFKERKKILLCELPIRTEGVCVGVKDSSSQFLKFLDKNKIALGDKITIVDREKFDSSMHLKVGERAVHISQKIASNLYLKLI
ncbi:metal-dependent transcriptional regulator [Cellulophaga sp. F20128]|uniref:metal-dependent transcriptional regulator n=1 Tax=Cellulophaga sp. F20128 TaxID=2926413 RepID=UPI001FF11546|nr:metal-dependent transcriptional regulator [Cellulophaga sp. F20128]MCK0155706.1 metal-dependent transcriptional regulator [Cellulophaga sp. F20128]